MDKRQSPQRRYQLQLDDLAIVSVLLHQIKAGGTPQAGVLNQIQQGSKIALHILVFQKGPACFLFV